MAALAPGALAYLTFGGLYLYDHKAGARQAKWSDPPSLDRGVRESLLWAPPNLDTAAAISDALAFGAYSGAYLVAYLAAWRAPYKEAPQTFIDTLEALAFTTLATQAVKMAAARERPYSYFQTIPPKGLDDNRSFFSGHTSQAFAGALSLAAILSRRDPHRKPWYFAGAATIGGAVGYLRIASDRHYLSDVISGAAVGTLITALSFSQKPLFNNSRAVLQIVPGRSSLQLAVYLPL